MSRWIYGLNPVREAMRAGGKIKSLYLFSGRMREAAALKDEAQALGVSVKVINDPAFFDQRFPKGHQGIAAEAEQQETLGIKELLAIPGQRGETPFFVVLDLIEDPRNLGAILRSADAAGVHGVVSQERRAASLTPEARKTSAGASEHIPFCIISNIKHALDAMRDEGIYILGSEGDPSLGSKGDTGQLIWQIDLTVPLALVIGSEGKGLRRTVMTHCDNIVNLPMRGHVNSLNASVAAGILFYEVLRQRMGGK